MSRTGNANFLIDRIEPFIQLEFAIIVALLAFFAWLSAKILLRHINMERKSSLSILLNDLGFYVVIGIIFFSCFYFLSQISLQYPSIQKILGYLGLATILAGSTIFVKTWRIFLFTYLFLSYKSVAFPLLLVNLFTLLLSLTLGAWIGTEIFSLKLAPLLATSAIFSLVLGLALQDTLGNLFAGVSLQIDKPYELGDWVEVHNNGQKWVGKIHDITWRATRILAFSEELITVPNRVMAQAEILNFSTRFRPIIRSQFFRFPFHVDMQLINHILINAAKSVPQIRSFPAPSVLIADITESWLAVRIVYSIENYGDQFRIADEIYKNVLNAIQKHDISFAMTQVRVQSSVSST